MDELMRVERIWGSVAEYNREKDQFPDPDLIPKRSYRNLPDWLSSMVCDEEHHCDGVLVIGENEFGQDYGCKYEICPYGLK
jgi:hypothetical protein